MYFESQHSTGESEFIIEDYCSSFSIPHLHRSFEILSQFSGETEVRLGERVFRLSPGFSVLIFPYQIHSFKKISEGKTRFCLFSPELVSDFSNKNKGRLPGDNVFRFLIDESWDLGNVYLCRSAAYAICGAFDCGREYNVIPEAPGKDVLTEMFLYADANFKSDRVLSSAAKSIGYDYAYISKFFKRRTGVPFSRYVNMLRIRESEKLLRSTDMSVSEIRSACGFSTLRTFNREFLSMNGVSPSEYRKQRAPGGKGK